MRLVLEDLRSVALALDTNDEATALASLLDRLVDDASADGFGEEDRSEARRILYALDAILRLHFAQEEELLASLAIDGPPHP